MRSLIKSHKESSSATRARPREAMEPSSTVSAGRKLTNPIKSFLRHKMSSTGLGSSGSAKTKPTPASSRISKVPDLEKDGDLQTPTIFGKKTHDWSADASPRSLVYAFEKSEFSAQVTPETSKEDEEPPKLNTESTDDFSIVVVKRREEPQSDSCSSSISSHFSFEGTGRNASLKYYKSYDQVKYEEMKAQLKQNQDHFKEFINDTESLNDLQEDMNFYDDKDLDDSEDLFNRKLFSSDEEADDYENFDSPKKDAPEQLLTLNGQYSFHSDQEVTIDDLSPPLVATDPSSSDIQDLVTKFRSSSIKYHQLESNDGDELEFLAQRYSWYPDDELPKTEPLDSLLDEINEIPEDFDFESELSLPQRTSSSVMRKQRRKQLLKSNSKFNYAGAPNSSNDRIKTGNRTITLFKPVSRSNSLEFNHHDKPLPEHPVDASASEEYTDELEDSTELVSLSTPIQLHCFGPHSDSPLTTISEASYDSAAARSPLR
ncbi:hypothetical protein KL905_001022 [Ogataea polymorpha]|uniref:uncharacterized protein n=1 Tax=Ogataea polymorpha TaxID=460523 RepID=UPI0007F36D12|nr:uncharacterized protein OGAPODRAFT_76725 [Ogataea polymorpha]KAG7881494.1 hypothetical protein KL937_001117 [Ogataea polymorpha]KAG7891164.1 hypothetical protein KL908_003917 [Ogataea polymorpha]KAG7910259.1 hypothetical protein KL907_001150 [Ogataea polymorpha]KAG7910775.1 hypothetical protein KL906_001155 [Ogataea polymorpha]KAG7923804.1 hypothetical protein KL905_001022 [Ogataea polymorpha]